ncbi:MAG TPA: tRNA (adenosine(37)-N6)-threonylcarbamoyltransferase complex dimerization subunit type 1 TsaB [Thermoanaerobaculia bacterium]
MTPAPDPAAPVLALDAGSPTVSVALGRGGEVLAARSEAISRSSKRLLQMIDEVLAEAGVEREGLGGIVALRGPGSFTGLRVGLATALGLHLALGVPAAALPTLLVLAAAAACCEAEVLAAVDALRGEWTVQPFAGDPPRALGEAETVPAAALAARAPVAIIGFGVMAALPHLAEWSAASEAPRLYEPGPLAPIALSLLPRLTLDWDPALLTDPLYARPPAVTTPGAPKTQRR